MTGQSNAAELLQRALELPAEDRLALATELLNSVEGPEYRMESLHAL
jgi:hypothetical protein